MVHVHVMVDLAEGNRGPHRAGGAFLRRALRILPLLLRLIHLCVQIRHLPEYRGVKRVVLARVVAALIEYYGKVQQAEPEP